MRTRVPATTSMQRLFLCFHGGRGNLEIPILPLTDHVEVALPRIDDFNLGNFAVTPDGAAMAVRIVHDDNEIIEADQRASDALTCWKRDSDGARRCRSRRRTQHAGGTTG